MSDDACKKCNKYITKYTTNRVVESPYHDSITKTYNIKLCWGCGYFSIFPNVRDEFTHAILQNRFLLIDLIENKEIIPTSFFK
jgi:hypothetical protein